MSEVVLSSAVRNNLLSLQNTAEMLGKTQNRLATGLRVNSALDDPTAFFTASSLNSRAGDLNRLLDSVGLAIETLRTADQAMSSITKLVESAQATARQALQSPAAAANAATVSGTLDLVADDPAVAQGNVDVSSAIDLTTAHDDETITVTVNGEQHVFTIGDTGSDTDELVAWLDGLDGISAVIDGDDFIAITADDNETSFSIAYSDPGIATTIGVDAGTYAPTNDDIVNDLDGETLEITVGGNATLTLEFGTGAGQIDSIHALNEALAALQGGTASIVNGELTITATSNADSIVVDTSDAAVNDALGLTNGTTAPTPGVNATRTTLETQLNTLLVQINELAADAGFNGVNLLGGDNLEVIFNEDRTSSLTIQGVSFDSAGLGLSTVNAGDWQTNAGIDQTLDELNTAVQSLRAQATTFGSNMSIVETRQDFTKNLINTLQSGAAGLTLADTNEEGANMLALQTRQQLSSVALSMAAQADQNVLRLF